VLKKRTGKKKKKEQLKRHLTVELQPTIQGKGRRNKCTARCDTCCAVKATHAQFSHHDRNPTTLWEKGPWDDTSHRTGVTS